MRALILGLALALSLFTTSAAAADTATNAPHVLTFTTSDSFGDFVWDGVVDGDATGTLQTRLTAARAAGQVLHVEFEWEVDAGEQSFLAELTGTLNLDTGAVVMNGTVVEGWLQGARVHEQGHLVDADSSTFVGTIRIHPATAG